MAVEISLIDRGLRVIVLVTIASNLMASEENIPVEVTRRLSGDIYYLNTIVHSCQGNSSYLVSEDRCVENQELFNGNTCSHCNNCN